jgi:hypothetical protein
MQVKLFDFLASNTPLYQQPDLDSWPRGGVPWPRGSRLISRSGAIPITGRSPCRASYARSSVRPWSAAHYTRAMWPKLTSWVKITEAKEHFARLANRPVASDTVPSEALVRVDEYAREVYKAELAKMHAASGAWDTSELDGASTDIWHAYEGSDLRTGRAASRHLLSAAYNRTRLGALHGCW